MLVLTAAEKCRKGIKSEVTERIPVLTGTSAKIPLAVTALTAGVPPVSLAKGISVITG